MCRYVWWVKNYLCDTISSLKNVWIERKVQKLLINLKNLGNILSWHSFTFIWYLCTYVNLKSLLSFNGRCSRTEHSQHKANEFRWYIKQIIETSLILRMGSKWVLNRPFKHGKTAKKPLLINSFKIRFRKIFSNYNWLVR